MSNEFEVKILNINEELIKNKLLNKGANLVKDEYQITYIFDFPDDRFKKEDNLFRIRETRDFLHNTTTFTLTFKKSKEKSEFREMEEYNTDVSEVESTKKILIELGMYNRAVIYKYRKSYEINGILYEFDKFERNNKVNSYLEVEANSSENLKIGLEIIGYTYDSKDVTAEGINIL